MPHSFTPQLPALSLSWTDSRAFPWLRLRAAAICGLLSAVALWLLPHLPATAAEPVAASDYAVTTNDWPWWRGQQRDGTAPEQRIPRAWSERENVLWRVPVPGRGHASPIVVGSRVVVATADESAQTQSLICYAREDGRQLWSRVLHQGELDRKGHQKTSQASATPASDGRRIYVNFLHDHAIHTSAVDLQGKRLWQVRVSDFQTHQGFGSSPTLYGPLVIVATDNKAGGAIVALQRQTGEEVWRVARPKLPNYTSPIVLRTAGREQLLLAGCNLITSLNPLTGEKFWEVEGSTTECVGTIVTDGQRVFASGGYPEKLTVAVQADGSGVTAWKNTVQTYVPSMLVHRGHLFTVTDNGLAICWDAASGREIWKARLGGTFNTSPVRVGELILATNQAGKSFLFAANPERYEQIATNELGDDVYATPTVCGDHIYMRVAQRTDGQRQEWLYCLGSSAGGAEKTR